MRRAHSIRWIALEPYAFGGHGFTGKGFNPALAVAVRQVSSRLAPSSEQPGLAALET